MEAPPPDGQDDAAGTWVQTAGPRGTDRATSLHVVEETLLLGTWSGIVLSTDGGGSWSEGSDLPAGFVSATAAAADALYAALDYAALYRSDDGGGGWRQVPTPGGVISLATAGEQLFAVVVGDETGAPVALRSADRGATWEELAPIDASGYGPYRIFSGGDLLFAPTFDGLLLRSEDHGASWTVLEDVEPLVAQAAALGHHAGSLFATSATTGTIFRSIDRGATWAVSLQLAEPDVRPWSAYAAAWLVESADGFFAALGSGGVFRWDEAGSSWLDASAGLPRGLVTGFGGGRAGAFAVVEDRLLRFDPALERWAALPSAPVRTRVERLAGAAGSLFAFDLYGRIDRSTDGGATWRRLPPPGEGAPPITAIAAAGGAVWAGTATQGIFRSDDGGASWRSASGGFPTYRGTMGMQFREVVGLVRLGEALFAATGAGYERNADPRDPVQVTGAGVWRSDDGGASWSPARDGLPMRLVAGARRFEPLEALAAAGDRLLAGTTGGALYLSRDGGESWAPAGEGIGRVSATEAVQTMQIAAAGEEVWVADGAGRLFRSVDGGLRFEAVEGPGRVAALAAGEAGVAIAWAEAGIDLAAPGAERLTLGRNLPAAPVLCLARAGGGWFAGTVGAGVWRLAP